MEPPQPNAATTSISTEEWLNSLKRTKKVPAVCLRQTSKQEPSCDGRQTESAVVVADRTASKCEPAAASDDRSSVYSVDADGFYTSMLTDCGIGTTDTGCRLSAASSGVCSSLTIANADDDGDSVALSRRETSDCDSAYSGAASPSFLSKVKDALVSLWGFGRTKADAMVETSVTPLPLQPPQPPKNNEDVEAKVDHCERTSTPSSDLLTEIQKLAALADKIASSKRRASAAGNKEAASSWNSGEALQSGNGAALENHTTTDFLRCGRFSSDVSRQKNELFSLKQRISAVKAGRESSAWPLLPGVRQVSGNAIIKPDGVLQPFSGVSSVRSTANPADNSGSARISGVGKMPSDDPRYLSPRHNSFKGTEPVSGIAESLFQPTITDIAAGRSFKESRYSDRTYPAQRLEDHLPGIDPEANVSIPEKYRHSLFVRPNYRSTEATAPSCADDEEDWKAVGESHWSSLNREGMPWRDYDAKMEDREPMYDSYSRQRPISYTVYPLADDVSPFGRIDSSYDTYGTFPRTCSRQKTLPRRMPIPLVDVDVWQMVSEDCRQVNTSDNRQEHRQEYLQEHKQEKRLENRQEHRQEHQQKHRQEERQKYSTRYAENDEFFSNGRFPRGATPSDWPRISAAHAIPTPLPDCSSSLRRPPPPLGPVRAGTPAATAVIPAVGSISNFETTTDEKAMQRTSWQEISSMLDKQLKEIELLDAQQQKMASNNICIRSLSRNDVVVGGVENSENKKWIRVSTAVSADCGSNPVLDSMQTPGGIQNGKPDQRAYVSAYPMPPPSRLMDPDICDDFDDASSTCTLTDDNVDAFTKPDFVVATGNAYRNAPSSWKPSAGAECSQADESKDHSERLSFSKQTCLYCQNEASFELSATYGDVPLSRRSAWESSPIIQRTLASRRAFFSDQREQAVSSNPNAAAPASGFSTAADGRRREGNLESPRPTDLQLTFPSDERNYVATFIGMFHNKTLTTAPKAAGDRLMMSSPCTSSGLGSSLDNSPCTVPSSPMIDDF